MSSSPNGGLSVPSDDCPYCSQMPLVGTDPPLQAASQYNEVLFDGPGVVVTPTLGMLVPGYLLAVSKNHVEALSVLGAGPLGALEKWLMATTEMLTSIFGPYVLFEHGSAGGRGEAS